MGYDTSELKSDLDAFQTSMIVEDNATRSVTTNVAFPEIHRPRMQRLHMVCVRVVLFEVYPKTCEGKAAELYRQKFQECPYKKESRPCAMKVKGG